MSALARAQALLPVALLLADASPAQQAGRPPAGFVRVLWVDGTAAADAATLQRVRAAGFDAINLGPGADPAAVVAAGLRYYLDQPAGKGHLELRDAEWRPLVEAYERQRDSSLLLRPGCLSEPAFATEVGARLRRAIEGARGDGLLFVALADEASWTRHNNPLDVCRCEHCLAAFAAAMQARYGTIEALGEAWGTAAGSFRTLVPLTTDQIRRRELTGPGLPLNLTPFRDWLEFTEHRFAAMVHALADAARQQLPDVPIGLTGLQPPSAFGGHDYERLLPKLSLLEPYAIGGAPELARSFAPRAGFYSTWSVPEDPRGCRELAVAQLCRAAADGDQGIVVWNAARGLLPDGRTAPALQAFQEAFAAMQPALDACAGARVLDAAVWLVESRASVQAWWMLDSERDGLTWVRRLSSHEATHSTSLLARRSWLSLLSDLGVACRFVAEDGLPERLLRERPRCVVLPAQLALADRTCQALAVYVQHGGTVLADHSAALYDDRLRRRSESAGLDALFGIRSRSWLKTDLRVREGRLLPGAARLPVAETGLEVQLGERCGDDHVFVEQRLGKGRAVCLNLAVAIYESLRLEPQQTRAAQELRRRVRQVLQSAGADPVCDVRGEGLPTCVSRRLLRTRDGRALLAIRIDALARPALLSDLARTGLRPVRVVFPRPVALRTLAGLPLGTAAEFELELDVHAGLFVEVGGR